MEIIYWILGVAVAVGVMGAAVAWQLSRRPRVADQSAQRSGGPGGPQGPV